jgi:hypothetical protein
MGKDRLAMSIKERNRKVFLDAVKEGQYTLVEASKKLSLSYRQTKRIYARYQLKGDQGLIHGSCGKASHNAYSNEFREKVLNLYRIKYEGFGPVLACEKLAKEGYHFSDESLRTWLIEEGLWDRKRKRSPYRKSRERRACFGELLQLDGSFHQWFGEDKPRACLMNLIDDATGKTLSLLSQEETTEAAMVLLKKWIERYGVPSAIYVDLKTVYVSPKRGETEGEEGLEFKEGFTHFSAACKKLGIRIIKAYSPQAKGRVERNHAVYQDRFVKELRLESIKTIAEGNTLLESSFVAELNEKFAKVPRSDIDAHRDPKAYGSLDQIFCWEYTRVVQQDWTIRFLKGCYQIENMKPLVVRPKNKITVRQHLDGSITLWFKEKRLPASKIELQAQIKIEKQKVGYDSLLRSKNATKNKVKTSFNYGDPGLIKKAILKEKTALTS